MCPIRPRNWVFSTIAGYLAHVSSLHITPVIHAGWHQESHRRWMSFKRDACIEYCKWRTVTTSLMIDEEILYSRIPDTRHNSRKRKSRMARHILRLPKDWPAKTAILWIPTKGKEWPKKHGDLTLHIEKLLNSSFSINLFCLKDLAHFSYIYPTKEPSLNQ